MPGVLIKDNQLTTSIQLGGRWEPYDQETSDFIEEASHAAGTQAIRVQLGSDVFVIDLLNKQQISESSGASTCWIDELWSQALSGLLDVLHGTRVKKVGVQNSLSGEFQRYMSKSVTFSVGELWGLSASACMQPNEVKEMLKSIPEGDDAAKHLCALSSM